MIFYCCGVWTEACVDATVKAALKLGFRVALVKDACGSGSAAVAILLTQWSEASGVVELETRSGKTLRVSLQRHGSAWQPSLAGEGRVVFAGHLAEL